MRLRLHPDADIEALEAKSWIREDDPLQATLFVEALENVFAKIKKTPDRYRTFDGDFRKLRVGKFTYGVVYRIRKPEIQVIAIMHLHREPRYWKTRKFAP